MASRITRVRWSAQNIPWGLSFDENTGTFSGKPETPGAYSVYVTVETNYGADSKYVTIIVEAPEEKLPVISPDQTITVTADTEMSGYAIQGTNVRASS